MTNAWSGADPTLFQEPGVDYELGVRYLVNSDINITSIRVYGAVPGGTVSAPNRNAYIRTTGDVILATVDMPDSLPFGWNTVALALPLNVSPGTTIWATYPVLSDYCIVASAYPRNSADNGVTANSGGFNNNPGNLPNNLTTTFYGIDFVYSVINHFPPTVTVSAITSDLTATATAVVTDDHPETVLMQFEWGDGAVTNVGTDPGPHAHTYAAPGIYVILVTATDADLNVDAGATYVRVTVPGITDASESWVQTILDAIVSDVQLTGVCDQINTHEPKRKPGYGVTAAIWCDGIEPIGAASGLANSTALVTFVCRLMTNMLSEPQDMIDPHMMRAVSTLIRSWHDDFDFDLDPMVRNIDLLGQYSNGLRAQAGYIEMDNTMFRVFDINVPVIVNDVWPQAT
jgi:hypothetical protein